MDLMEELQEKMQYGEEDFAERLGRKKPEAVEMEVKLEGESEEMPEGFEEEEGPEEKLKSRLLKLRGE